MIDIEFLQRMREILDKIEFLSEPIDEDVDNLFDEVREMIGEKETEIVLREIRADEENDRKGDTMKLCDEDCNHCPLMNHPNSRILTKVLNELFNKFGNGVYKIVQSHCPNFTVCHDCRQDDFCHVEGCELRPETEDGSKPTEQTEQTERTE